VGRGSYSLLLDCTVKLLVIQWYSQIASNTIPLLEGIAQRDEHEGDEHEGDEHEEDECKGDEHEDDERPNRITRMIVAS
jgi:hypothetical protein